VARNPKLHKAARLLVNVACIRQTIPLIPESWELQNLSLEGKSTGLAKTIKIPEESLDKNFVASID
jgi:hypothetical protein